MISRRLFDRYGGRDAFVYTLESDSLAVEVCDFGAAIRALRIKAAGDLDVCLGFNSLADYLGSKTYCGATVGRVANRIAGGRFTLGGRTYELDRNDGDNCNHSGFDGYDRRFFTARTDGDALTLTLDSPDGDQGFPGALSLAVRFAVRGNGLTISYTATSDRDTYFAPTCHAYFNLGGEGSGDATDTLVRIAADAFTPLNAAHIPTGEVRAVAGTPFDFRTAKPLVRDLASGDAQLTAASGYDHNFVLAGHPSATAFSPQTGVRLTLDTDLPGLQLYTANFLGGCPGKTTRYNARDAFCLEPQYFPNAVNTPSFPSPHLKAYETRTNYIKYKFEMK